MKIEELKSVNSSELKELYTRHRPAFLHFSRKYNLGQEDILDIYQDAFIALIENAKKGKLDNLKADLKTYLFATGKYMIYAKLKKKQIKNGEDVTLPDQIEWTEEENKEELFTQLEWALAQIGEPCYSLLKGYYYEKLKPEQLFKELGYTSKDVLKSQKWRCIQQIKALLKHGK